MFYCMHLQYGLSNVMHLPSAPALHDLSHYCIILILAPICYKRTRRFDLTNPRLLPQSLIRSAHKGHNRGVKSSCPTNTIDLVWHGLCPPPRSRQAMPDYGSHDPGTFNTSGSQDRPWNIDSCILLYAAVFAYTIQSHNYTCTCLPSPGSPSNGHKHKRCTCRGAPSMGPLEPHLKLCTTSIIMVVLYSCGAWLQQ